MSLFPYCSFSIILPSGLYMTLLVPVLIEYID